MEQILTAILANAGDNLAVLVLMLVVAGLFALLREQMNANKGMSESLKALGEIITQLRIEIARNEARK